MVHLKVFEAFAGVGSQHMALRNLGVDYEVVGVSEIDKFAHQAYEAIHGETKNFGDISKLQPEDLPDFDLFTYSFPCFTGGSLVYVKSKGYVPIKDIELGDFVLTHKGEYKKVKKHLNQGVKPIYEVSAMFSPKIKTTENHKFYVRTMSGSVVKARSELQQNPYWKEAKALTESDYVGFPVNKESKLPLWSSVEGNSEKDEKLLDLLVKPQFWWWVGRYLAKGTMQEGALIFEVDKLKFFTFKQCFNGIFTYKAQEEKNCYKVRVEDVDLFNFLLPTGKLEDLTFLPSWLDLPTNLLTYLVDGYLSGVGKFNGISWSVTSSSESILLGLSQAIMKVHQKPVSLRELGGYSSQKGGLTSSFTSYSSEPLHWVLEYKLKPTSLEEGFYDNGYMWGPVINTRSAGYEEEVYDIEVADHHSFTVKNSIVHNCTDLSSAGLQRGFEKGSGTSSSLLWECQRLIEGKKPKVLLLENVKALMSNKFLGGFHSWLRVLAELGYTNYYGILNAKDFGLPQNRERVFVVSILGEHKPYHFPSGYETRSTMADLLGSPLDTKKWHKQYNIDRFKYELRDTGLVHYLGRFNVPIEYKLEKMKEQGLDSVSESDVRESIGMRTQCLFPTGKVSCMLASDYKYPKTVVEGIGCEVPKKLYVSSPEDKTARPFVEYERGLKESREDLAKDDSVLWLSSEQPLGKGGLFDFFAEVVDKDSTELDFAEGFYSMRYLTPGEGWKFMGFSYKDYSKAKATGLSDLQLYKQAGNSIAVPCLEALFKEIYVSLGA